MVRFGLKIDLYCIFISEASFELKIDLYCILISDGQIWVKDRYVLHIYK